MRFIAEERKRDQSPIPTALIVGSAVFLIVWFLRSLSMALAMAAAAALLTWGTSTWLQSEAKITFQGAVSDTLSIGSERAYKIKEKEFIPLVVGLLAWGVSKLLVGQFLGLMVGGLLGWLLYNRLEEKERKRLEEERMKKRVEEVVSGALGFGAAAGAAALAAWGLSKAFGGGGEPSRGNGSDEGEDKMMKAPGRDFYMPRKNFEDNPSAYFRRLRGKEIIS